MTSTNQLQLIKKNLQMMTKYNEIYLREYSNIMTLIIISLIFGTILLLFSYLVSKKRKKNPEKLSAYECGFDTFDSSRQSFEIHFYLIGILFILFDLEIALIFPWAMLLSNMSNFANWVVIDFLVELTIGFIFAWRYGAIDWN